MSSISMRVLTDAGVDEFEVPDATERSTVSAHWNAVQAFLGDAPVEVLAPFEAERVVGRRLQVDPDEIEKWAYEGELDFEDIYSS
jgi:hypothetical protein